MYECLWNQNDSVFWWSQWRGYKLLLWVPSKYQKLNKISCQNRAKKGNTNRILSLFPTKTFCFRETTHHENEIERRNHRNILKTLYNNDNNYQHNCIDVKNLQKQKLFYIEKFLHEEESFSFFKSFRFSKNFSISVYSGQWRKSDWIFPFRTFSKKRNSFFWSRSAVPKNALARFYL